MTMLDIILERNRLKTSHYTDQEFSDYGNFSVASAMKEYAEWYAKECLKIAADSAIIYTDSIGEDNFMIETSFVVKESIIEIKLPDHD